MISEPQIKPGYKTSQLIKAEESFKARMDHMEFLLIKEETLKLAYDSLLLCIFHKESVNKVVMHQSGITIALDELGSVDTDKLEKIFEENKNIFNRYLVSFGTYKHKVGKERFLYINCNEDIHIMKGGTPEKIKLMLTRANAELFPHIHKYLYGPKR